MDEVKAGAMNWTADNHTSLWELVTEVYQFAEQDSSNGTVVQGENNATLVFLEVNSTFDQVTTTCVSTSTGGNYTHDGNVTEDFYDYHYSEELGWLRHSICVTAIYCFAYFTIFVLGIFGNYFVVAVVLRTPRMRTVTNYFIVNLALADILVIIFCLPATLLSNIFIPWVLGWVMCKSVAYVQGLSVAASVYSLVAVSLDRFLAICYPLRCQLTKSRAKIVIVIIWIGSLIIPIPWGLYFSLAQYASNNPDLLICNEMWPSRQAENLYFMAVILLDYILPLLVIAYCYIMIWLKVRSRNIPGETKGGQMDNMIQKSKVKVIEMLVVVIVLFMLSWLPLYVIFARMKLGGEIIPGGLEENLLSIIAPIAQWLGSSNSCINPIMYAFFNDKYRKGFVAIIKSRRCCGKLASQYDDMRSTIRRTDFKKNRQWRDTQVELLSTTSGV